MSGIGIKRVLVALENERDAINALQCAAEIASRLQAELFGYFVEDENLLALSELPIAHELVHGTRTTLTRSGMERSLQRRAENLRLEMESTLAHWQLRGEFQTLRGEIASQLLSVTQQEDLLVMGKAVRSSLTWQLGQTTQMIWQQATCSLALLPSGKKLARPVVVFVEDTPTGMKALELAKQLAQADSYNLTVLIPALPSDQETSLENRIRGMLDQDNIPPRIIPLTSNMAEEILLIAQQQRGRLFILPAQNQALNTTEQQKLITGMQVPVLVMR